MGYIRIRRKKSARHQYYADKAFNAQNRTSALWGGRYADGILDKYDPSVFKYTKKVNRGNRRPTYYYTTKKRKTWPSYGRKYGNRQ